MFTKTMKMLVVAGGLLLAGACTDLGVNPVSTITDANAFNEPGSYRQYLAKIYGGLALTGQAGPAGIPDIQGIDEGFSQYIRLVWQMQELPTDEAHIAWGDQGVQELNTQIWATNNQFLGAMYYRIYFQVALVNEFLRQTTDDKLNARNVSDALRADIRQFRAEARFLRALSYWHGIDLFANIPLVQEDFQLGKVPPQQSTRAAVFDFVVAELNAIRPDLPPAKTGQYGRVDQAGVSMLLAKLYLNAGVYTGTTRYAEARTAAEAVINSNAYQLDDHYRDIFLADNHTSPEIIFAVPFDGEHTQNFGGTTFLIHASVGGNMAAADWGIDGGWFGLRVKPEFVALFPGGAASSDTRGSGVLFTDGQQLAIDNPFSFNHGLGAPKYKNITSTGEPGKDLGFPDTDYPMFRLADAYLMYAEAVLRGGGGSLAQALTYVNALRQRAYGGTSGNITQAELTLDFILAERSRELFWEGHRRTDLVRFNRFTQNGVWQWKGGIKAGRTTEQFRDLYPLPATEIVANPNLSQNPGYGS